MTFKRCVAFKPDGQRCQRVASAGSTFCHSHRLHPPPDLSGLRYYPDLDIYLSEYQAIPVCSECGSLIENRLLLTYGLPDGEVLLCESCFDRRVLVEQIILEQVYSAKMPISKLDLLKLVVGNYGVDGPIADAVIGRLLKQGKIIEEH